MPSFFVFRDTTGRVLPISLYLVFFGDWKLKVFSVAERSDIAEKCVFVLNLQSSPQFSSRDFTSLHVKPCCLLRMSLDTASFPCHSRLAGLNFASILFAISFVTYSKAIRFLRHFFIACICLPFLHLFIVIFVTI